ncbi:hypothetical protein JL475_00575 [Streptomyces sp. M2CJ-2]|uniref:hypothetical protein n=1 Tax=Streptomyces sp. M2CJ-2 TaxID=2803948 RepID=UPI0019244627|nr:hypothetical protein [Streptomyces sp. M2CJ-2]MBL3664541.1 hypothetical protein [Streptomyces sp. M2CJ-2]
MPALATLVDDFNDNAIDPAKWPNNYGGPTEVGGRARVPCTAGYAAYATAATYWLNGSSLYCRLYPPAAGGATTEAWAQILITSTTAGTDVIFEVNTVTGRLVMAARAAYADAAQVSIPYDPVAHAWLRVRETGGPLLWDTSPDGITWTNRRTLATSPAWVANTNLQLQLISHRDSGINDYVEFDNVNVAPAPPADPGAARKAAFLAFL